MYKYKVKQTQTKSYFFNWFTSEYEKVYLFNTYNNALIFCQAKK